MTHSGPQYRIAEQVLARNAGTEMILLSMTSERYFALKGSGPRVWEVLSQRGSATAHDVVDVLVEEYEVERSVLDVDVTAMLLTLVQHGLVIEA